MDLIKIFSSEWGALRFFAGFVLLPFLYARESIDVHKACRAALDKITDDIKRQRRSAELQEHLHFFRFEWWLIAATTILLIGVFALGDLATFSSLVESQQSSAGPIVDGPPADLATGQLTEAPEGLSPAYVRGILNAFGCVVAVAAMWCVEWAKLGVYRTLLEE